MVNDFEYNLQILSCCLQGLIVIVLTSAFGLTLKRVDFKIESWAMVIQVFYIISALVSFLSWVIYFANGKPTSITERDPYDCLQDVAELIVYTILYFFIFECRDFYNKIKCDTSIEYHAELKKLKVMRFIAIALNLGISLANIGITFYFAMTDYDDATMNSYRESLLQTSLILYLCTLVLDLAMAVQFVLLAIFFIRAKLEKY